MIHWNELRDTCTIFEDDGILVLNKPAGLTIVGGGADGDLIALARAGGETLVPVHRIDRVTSGAVLLAKEPRVHASLTRQMRRRAVERLYLAVTRSRGLPERGTIDLPLSVGRKDRIRVAAPRASIVFDPTQGYWSVTPDARFDDVRVYPSETVFARAWEDERHTLLVVRPITGRRHQIRVHLAWIGHPIEGDPLFDRARTAPRTLLHAWRIAFERDWLDGMRLSIEAPPGVDFWAPLRGELPGGAAGTLLDRARTAFGTRFDESHVPGDSG